MVTYFFFPFALYILALLKFRVPHQHASYINVNGTLTDLKTDDGTNKIFKRNSTYNRIILLAVESQRNGQILSLSPLTFVSHPSSSVLC